MRKVTNGIQMRCLMATDGTEIPIVHKFKLAQLLPGFNNLHVIKQEIQLGFNLFHMGRPQMETRNPFKQNKERERKKKKDNHVAGG